MKKVSVIIMVACSMLLINSGFKPQSNLSITLSNPCSKDVLFSQGDRPGSTSVFITVSAGKTKTWHVEEGRFINYKPAPGKNYIPIGKVEYKGQVFTCGCQ